MISIDRQQWLAIGKKTYAEFIEDRVSIVASGVAFRVALALFPAIALLVWVGTRVVGPDEAKSLVETLSGLLPDASRSVIKGAVDSAVQDNPANGGAESKWLGAFAPIVGVMVTLWSTNSGMKALFAALNIVYDKKESRGFLWRNLVTAAFTLGALLLLIVAIGALAASPFILSHLGFAATVSTAIHRLRWPVLFLAFALALALLYRFAPNREREHWPLITVGSALAAGLVVLSSALFSWFTGRFMGLSATYGSLSTVVAFELWLWIDILAILACAELDATIERESGLYGGSGRKQQKKALPDEP